MSHPAPCCSPRSSRRHSTRLGPHFAFLPIAVALGLLATGCNSPELDTPYQPSRNAEQQEDDDFDRGFELVSGFGEFDPEQASLEASFRFNQWLKEQSAPQWELDPLVAGLAEPLRRSEPIQQLERDSVKVDDMYYMRQALWARQISDWASEQPSNPLLDEWFEQRGDALGKATARQLRVAERLFDWTVRNVQLQPLMPTAEQQWADQQRQSGGSTPPPKDQSLAALGLPGPGYIYHPWEVLMYGRGDTYQRARVFTLLARQQGIPVVMLAIAQPDGPPRPWLPAAYLNQQLYLFDPMLGLPVPDETGRGIVSLSEVQANPKLLDNLDIGSQYTYPVDEQSLERLVVLFDAAPQALSKRMKQIEGRLTGERRLALTTRPSRLADQLRNLDGIQEVQLWSVPVETTLFRQRLDQILENDDAARAAFLQERAPFAGINSLVRGRDFHFRRQFEEEGDEVGAMQLYMEMRVPDDKIQRLAYDPDTQLEYGLQRDLDEAEDDWMNRIRFIQMVYSQGKLHASYWIGLIHYENGDYQDAVFWLRDRTLDAYPDGPWTDGARYNLGRSYEALGQWEKARQLYLVDESPQQHGNLLRAEMLETEGE